MAEAVNVPCPAVRAAVFARIAIVQDSEKWENYLGVAVIAAESEKP
jgi:hypothetical protein